MFISGKILLIRLSSLLCYPWSSINFFMWVLILSIQRWSAPLVQKQLVWSVWLAVCISSWSIRLLLSDWVEQSWWHNISSKKSANNIAKCAVAQSTVPSFWPVQSVFWLLFFRKVSCSCYSDKQSRWFWTCQDLFVGSIGLIPIASNIRRNQWQFEMDWPHEGLI